MNADERRMFTKDLRWGAWIPDAKKPPLSLNLVGNKFVFMGLTDRSLDRRFALCYAVDMQRERVQVDFSPKGTQFDSVRVVSLPYSKVICISRTSASAFGANLRDYLEANGMAPETLCCLQSRPHPAVRYAMAHQDVPVLCDAHGLTAVMGWHIFPSVGTDGDCAYCNESTTVLMRKDGVFVDVSLDLSASCDFKVPEMAAKLFVPDPEQARLIEAATHIKQLAFMRLPKLNAMYDDLGVGDEGMAPDEVTPDESDEYKVLTILSPNKKMIDVRNKRSITDHKDHVRHCTRHAQQGVIVVTRELALECVNANVTKLAGGTILSCHCGDTEGWYRHSVCCSCSVRTNDPVICTVCEKASYCSEACRILHLKAHQRVCAPPEERARRAERKKQIDKEQEERVERCKTRETRETEEYLHAAAAEAERRAKIAVERAARAAAAAGPDVPVRPPPRAAPRSTKKRAKARLVEQEMVHAVHTSADQKALRTEAFNLKQAAEHAEAEAKKARAAADEAREREEQAGKLAAEQEQPKPTRRMLGDFVSPGA